MPGHERAEVAADHVAVELPVRAGVGPLLFGEAELVDVGGIRGDDRRRHFGMRGQGPVTEDRRHENESAGLAESPAFDRHGQALEEQRPHAGDDRRIVDLEDDRQFAPARDPDRGEQEQGIAFVDEIDAGIAPQPGQDAPGDDRVVGDFGQFEERLRQPGDEAHPPLRLSRRRHRLRARVRIGAGQRHDVDHVSIGAQGIGDAADVHALDRFALGAVVVEHVPRRGFRHRRCFRCQWAWPGTCREYNCTAFLLTSAACSVVALRPALASRRPT